GAAGLGKVRGGLLEEMAAVARTGQHIAGGQPVQLTLQGLLLGDVLGDTDDQGLPTGLANRFDEALVADPAHLAVTANDAVLALLHRAQLQRRLQALHGVLHVVRIDTAQPLAVIAEHQRGAAAEDAFVGRADVDHLLALPVEGPQHGIETAQQAAHQQFALAQALDLATAVQQGQGKGFHFARDLPAVIHETFLATILPEDYALFRRPAMPPGLPATSGHRPVAPPGLQACRPWLAEWHAATHRPERNK